ncbi:5-methylcytosine restriction system specificity protein McrC [Psychrobacter piechaudii]|uniref:5-methylcytosine restriction system specificity protein McrC n=1 Tax=Psychrobacter piechaudii TaxID=1945521 RepID=UPI00117B7325|nr:hypothetical protein [Psychrobacter piechaudii]
MQNADRYGAMNAYQHDGVISCFEHQRLSRQDFAHSIDFDYLIEQELPCFGIEVKRGQLSLVVSHYLAKIILPSGLTLEILPKISVATVAETRQSSSQRLTAMDSTVKRKAEIVQARQWVAVMLADISKDNIGKKLAALDLAAKPGFYSPSYPTIPPQLVSVSRTLDKPWYEGLLATIRQALQQAAVTLPNRYQTQLQNQPKAQGKINLAAQLKNNWHRPHYLYTEQAVFETDQLLAQFLTTAWQQLQKLSARNVINESSFDQQLPSSLQGVMVLPPRSWEGVYQQLKSNTATWGSQLSLVQAQVVTQAIEWGWWLLTQGSVAESRQSTFDKSVDQLPVASLMINMNHAFERWVLGKLQSWASQQLANSRLVIQPSFDWLYLKTNFPKSGLKSEVVQKLVPDACIMTQEGQISHVLDIKYKSLSAATQVSGADWQQLYSYQQRLNCQNAWLIYPKTKTFTQRLDVFDNLDENRHSNQDGDVSGRITQMSVIPFDPQQGLLLI